MSSEAIKELEQIVKDAVRVHDFYPNAAAKAILAAGYTKLEPTPADQEATAAEAHRRFPPSMLIEDYDGDRYVDDPYGYDECQREAFIAGAEWRAGQTPAIEPEVLVKLIQSDLLEDRDQSASSVQAQRIAEAVIAQLAQQPVTPTVETAIADYLDKLNAGVSETGDFGEGVRAALNQAAMHVRDGSWKDGA